jgi:vacuolar-type H+-ATPase subunit I/STV1
MIVPMKHLTVICVAAEQEATVEALRALGLIHLELATGESEQFRVAQTQLAATERAQIILHAAQMDKPVTAVPGTSLTRTPEQRAVLVEHQLIHWKFLVGAALLL